MEIVNQTPFEFAPLVGRIGFPKYSLTFIIKGTFDLVAEDTAVISDVQLPPTGDEPYADDAEGGGSVRYGSDFVYFKPCSDVLLSGTCHTPNAIPRKACPVTFCAGSMKKKLAVFGNRHWETPIQTISTPEPFITMELKYENSFGGKGYNKNPVGKGYTRDQSIDGKKIRPLPNIEDPSHLIGSPGDRPEPAGFGPLDQMWHERYSKIGTYGETWLKDRWPWFPADFDWHFFNLAPPDMQFDGYLKGDEALYLENLHSHHSHYRCRLPGIRARCFIGRPEKLQKEEFAEVPLNLDTLWVDMDAEKLALVWRGVTNILSEDYEDIHHIYIASEMLEEKRQSASFYFDKYVSHLNKKKRAFAPEVPDDSPEDAFDVAKEIANAEAEIEKAMRETKKALLGAGIETDIEPPPTSESDKALEAELLKELGIEITPKLLTREDIEERIKNGESLAGEDLRELDLTGLDMQGADVKEALFAMACLKNVNFSDAQLSGGNFEKADLKGAVLRGALLKDADFTQANLENADLSMAILDHAICEKANLKVALLEQARAKGCIFTGADLTGANLKKADLSRADFSKSKLEKADFEEANLKEASVEGAIGIRVNMEKADLTELRASEGCDFSSGKFRESSGDSSTWEGANLTGADFSFSTFAGASFTKAILDNANLFAADMPGTRFRNASLRRVKSIAMNLFRGSLEKADLTEGDFSASNLYEVEFLDARLKETKFESTNLKMTKLAKKL